MVYPLREIRSISSRGSIVFTNTLSTFFGKRGHRSSMILARFFPRNVLFTDGWDGWDGMGWDGRGTQSGFYFFSI